MRNRRASAASPRNDRFLQQRALVLGVLVYTLFSNGFLLFPGNRISHNSSRIVRHRSSRFKKKLHIRLDTPFQAAITAGDGIE